MIRQNDHAKSCKYRWPKQVHPIYHLFRGLVWLIGALMLSACQGNSQLSFMIDQQQITAFLKTLEQGVIAANATEVTPRSEPDTSDPLYIESFRQYRNSSPTEIEIVRALSATDFFTRYEIVYHSEGVHVSGLMNVPNSHAPDLAANSVENRSESRLPVILLNHGHYAWV